jgi:hypothetical protein
MLDAKTTSIDFKTKIPDLVGPDKKFSSRTYLAAFTLFFVGVLVSLHYLAGNTIDRVYERPEDITGQLQEFELPKLAAKKAGVQRIAYLSNSHGTTGGNVADHIRNILTRIDPGKYEVVNMASAGMYSSEMLLRTASSGKYDIDTFLYATNYVTFADRMTFQHQAVRVRHFFRDGVPFNAPLGFWLRNYDLPLYLDDAAGTIFPAFKKRPRNRQLWEPAVANWLKQFMGEESRIRFLQVDYRQAWRFPGGFPGNLFNWRLLEGKRDRQIADFADAVHLAKRDGAKVAVFNVPVDFTKYYLTQNEEDLNVFKLALKRASGEANLFQDYQGQFPAEFTTYDALHPNFYGARLHAFDMVTRLNDKGLLARRYETKQILSAFEDLGNEALESYIHELARIRGDLKGAAAPAWNWASLDITTPVFSLRWLNNIASGYESDPEKVQQIYSLLLQTHYLNIAPFTEQALNSAKGLGGEFLDAFSYERNLARKMNDLFLKNLKEVAYEWHDLKEMPVANGEKHSPPSESYQALRNCGSIRIVAASGKTAPEQHYFIDGDLVAVEATDRAGRTLRRTDVLGDKSFLLLEANVDSNRWFLPYGSICNKNGYATESAPARREAGVTN